jgi:hypothetical protein
VRFEEERHVRALLQNPGRSLGEIPGLLDELAEIETEYASIGDSELVHGKDAEEVLAKALSCFKVCKADSSRLLWTSYERAFANQEPNLQAAESFLTNGAE